MAIARAAVIIAMVLAIGTGIATTIHHPYCQPAGPRGQPDFFACLHLAAGLLGHPAKQTGRCAAVAVVAFTLDELMHISKPATLALLARPTLSR